MSERGERPTVITGCSGFVGANLAASLLAQGTRVVGIESPSGIDWRTRSLPGLELVRVDLCHEQEIRAVVCDLQPHVIFHCAAYGAYSVQANPRRIYDTNLLAVRHLLEAAREVTGFRAFVQAGSSSEYGFNCSAPDEDAPMLPDSDYAVSKVAAAALIRLYAHKHGVPGWVLRLYSLYGPFEDMSRLIPNLLLHAREGRFPPLVNPHISRDFVFVEDATRAFQAVVDRADRLRRGEAFNIGTGVRTTLGDLAALVKDLFHLGTEPQWGTMPDRAWDHAGWYANPAKARDELGWHAATSLRAGLAATMRWMDDNPTLVDEGRRTTVVAVRR